MNGFRQQTEALLIRRWIENAMDRGEMDEVMAMSRRLDEMTMRLLRDQRIAPLTATGGRA